MATTLGEFCGQIAQARQAYDGEAIAALLQQPFHTGNEEAWTPIALEASKNPSGFGAACANAGCPEGFEDVLGGVLQSVQLQTRKQYNEACDAMEGACESFTALYETAEGHWLVPVLQVLVLDLRLLAKKVDHILGLRREQSKMRFVKTYLDTCFRNTMMGRAPKTGGVNKRQAALFIVNNQLKVYFALGTLHLCKNVIRTVSLGNFPSLETFPLPQVVTYRFFLGRLAVLEDKIKEAESELMFAFTHCPKQYHSNVRLILEYLVPVKLILGQPPSTDILTRYNLTQLSEIASSVARGNVVALNSAIERHQNYLISRGLYLALNKLKLVTYRNMVRRVVRAQEKLVEAGEVDVKPHWLKLSSLLLAFKQWGEYDSVVASFLDTADNPVGEDEKMVLAKDQLECTVANLIFKGYVKGYIHHEKGLVVLSKKQAFPNVSLVNV